MLFPSLEETWERRPLPTLEGITPSVSQQGPNKTPFASAGPPSRVAKAVSGDAGGTYGSIPPQAKQGHLCVSGPTLTGGQSGIGGRGRPVPGAKGPSSMGWGGLRRADEQDSASPFRLGGSVASIRSQATGYSALGASTHWWFMRDDIPEAPKAAGGLPRARSPRYQQISSLSPARRLAEFKHITKRRKRNQQGFPQYRRGKREKSRLEARGSFVSPGDAAYGRVPGPGGWASKSAGTPRHRG